MKVQSSLNSLAMLPRVTIVANFLMKSIIISKIGSSVPVSTFEHQTTDESEVILNSGRMLRLRRGGPILLRRGHPNHHTECHF